MGLASLRCNKRNESSNRLSVNSIRATLTLHKPFIMMMPWSEIFHCGTQSLVWKGTLRDGWSTKVCLSLVYCRFLLFLWRFEAFQPIHQWKHAFHQATLRFPRQEPIEILCLKLCMTLKGYAAADLNWICVSEYSMCAKVTFFLPCSFVTWQQQIICKAIPHPTYILELIFSFFSCIFDEPLSLMLLLHLKVEREARRRRPRLAPNRPRPMGQTGPTFLCPLHLFTLYLAPRWTIIPTSTTKEEGTPFISFPCNDGQHSLCPSNRMLILFAVMTDVSSLRHLSCSEKMLTCLKEQVGACEREWQHQPIAVFNNRVLLFSRLSVFSAANYCITVHLEKTWRINVCTISSGSLKHTHSHTRTDGCKSIYSLILSSVQGKTLWLGKKTEKNIVLAVSCCFQHIGTQMVSD